MFILNNLENFILTKPTPEEPKRDSFEPITKSSNFNEILHQAVNEASKPEPDKLQTYSSMNSENAEKRDPILKSETFKTEIFNERMSKETKQVAHNKDFTTNDAEESIEKSSIKPERAIPEESNQDLPQKLLYAEKIENNKEIKAENFSTLEILPKEISSETLLQNFTQLEKKEDSLPREKKYISKNGKIEIKVEKKISTPDQNIDKIKPQQIHVNLHTKESEKLELKKTQLGTLQIKVKEPKVDLNVKEIAIKDNGTENGKVLPKEIKLEDASRLSTIHIKSKEVIGSSKETQKRTTENKQEKIVSTASNFAIQFGKEELTSKSLLSLDARKSKKNSDSESKEKSTSENTKPILRDFSGIEKDFRIAKETLIEVANLDKNKFHITRQEKNKEMANVERRKESLSLVNEISVKSNSAKENSDSDKSFSNPRYETNGFKMFADTFRTANAEKPQESGFNRENFSKSLNDLVSKARINIVENGKNTAQISLYPKDLGKMTLNIDVLRDKVEGKILVDSEFIKNRLLGDVSQLKADLKANGLDLQSISIEVRSDSSSAFDFANPSNENDSSRKKGEKVNASLPQQDSLEEETEYSQKSYNLVDIKI